MSLATIAGCVEGAREPAAAHAVRPVDDDSVVERVDEAAAAGPSPPWEAPPWPAWDASRVDVSVVGGEGAGGDVPVIDATLDAARDAAHVSDAADLRARAPDGASAYEDGAPRDTEAVAPHDAAEACRASLRINELQTGGDGEGRTGDEFVELYNAGECTAPLFGWTLRALSASGASGRLLWSGASELLAARGYFVIGSRTVLDRLAPDAAGVELRGSSTSGALSGTGGALGLFAPGSVRDDTIAHDSVGYAASPTNRYVRGQSAPAPPGGRSLARRVDGVDTGDNRSDFTVTASPTPASRNR